MNGIVIGKNENINVITALSSSESINNLQKSSASCYSYNVFSGGYYTNSKIEINYELGINSLYTSYYYPANLTSDFTFNFNLPTSLTGTYNIKLISDFMPSSTDYYATNVTLNNTNICSITIPYSKLNRFDTVFKSNNSSNLYAYIISMIKTN